MSSGNRLAGETSPYLRQHAENPVDWYPWGAEAFADAAARDVPVFLSVGYSACHWCHVMAHESFEDPAIAAVLNAGFVAVKVDREERPDVDAVYMDAVQAMSGRGGWPMSVFLTPDGRPFFGGTYFPPTDRHGMAGFPRLLEAISEAWAQRRPEVEAQADALAEAVARQSSLPDHLVGGAGTLPPFAPTLAAAVGELAGRFDAAWGGFGPAPKFPHPALVELCLRHHRLVGEADPAAGAGTTAPATGTAGPDALRMALVTLEAMAAGGMYDHLGGGFCRYATDDTWTVPHFEKMLYDQAGLVRAYLHAWQTTGDAQWRQVVEETVDYVLRDLRSPGGGLCSAEDADSEGEEGRFYLWDRAELEAVVGDDAPAAVDWYGLGSPPNFEGRYILRRPLGAGLVRPDAVTRARVLLFEHRAGRVRPGLDDKVLTEWNAMFLSSLAEAAAALGREDWAVAAGEIAEFLWRELRAEDGRWLRSWQGGRARHLAYSADYAWVVDAFTRMAELSGAPHWLARATTVATDMLRLFTHDSGVLATTGADAEALVVRPLELMDNATPSATAVAGTALVRLGALRADDELIGAGTRLLEALGPLAGEHPLAVASAVAGTELLAGGVTEVVVTGSRPELLATVRARYEPTSVLAWGEPDDSPLWEGRPDGFAFVCRRAVCAAPSPSPDELVARLDAERDTERAGYLAAAQP